jgi:hypothetical protein
MPLSFDSIATSAASKRRAIWIDHLPPALQEELETIRQQFQQTAIPKRAFAESLLKSLKEELAETPHLIPGVHSLLPWLSKKEG